MTNWGMRIPQFRHVVQVPWTPGLRWGFTCTHVPCSVWRDRKWGRRVRLEPSCSLHCYESENWGKTESHWIQTASLLHHRLTVCFYYFPSRKEAERNNVGIPPNCQHLCVAFTAEICVYGNVSWRLEHAARKLQITKCATLGSRYPFHRRSNSFC